MVRKVFALVSMVVILAAASVQAQEVDPARFKEAIQTFQTWDKKNSFQADSILFVGSSSVRFWATADAFPDKEIINRGFGGSHVSDVNFYFDSVVKPYSPSSLFLYAGDNDIGGGKSAERVLADFETFVSMVEAETSDTKIHYLSIKPSKARWKHWPEMSRANQLIKNLADKKANVTYVDMASALLDADEQPKDVFVDDGLHLNELGYKLWAESISPYLQ